MTLGWLSVAEHPYRFFFKLVSCSKDLKSRDAYTHRHGMKIVVVKVLYRTWYLLLWVFDVQTVWPSDKHTSFTAGRNVGRKCLFLTMKMEIVFLNNDSGKLNKYIAHILTYVLT
jgi:hypothetical protein